MVKVMVLSSEFIMAGGRCVGRGRPELARRRACQHLEITPTNLVLPQIFVLPSYQIVDYCLIKLDAFDFYPPDPSF